MRRRWGPRDTVADLLDLAVEAGTAVGIVAYRALGPATPPAATPPPERHPAPTRLRSADRDDPGPTSSALRQRHPHRMSGSADRATDSDHGGLGHAPAHLDY